MKIKYYIVKNQDINNDGLKEDLILKYRGDQFLGALPLKDYVDIDEYFSKMPVIPQKYYVVYTFHDYNRDKVKDHIMHIFSGNTNNYILSIPINKFMNNAKAYFEYNKISNKSNIYNLESNKQYRGGRKKGKKGGNPNQFQNMNVEETEEYLNKIPLKTWKDIENKQQLNKKLAMQNQQMQYQQMQNQQMQYPQMQNQQMQYPQMQNQQMQYPQMQNQQMQQVGYPANNIYNEPSRIDNTNSKLDKFIDATIAGGGLTLGSSIMNSVFDMFSGE